MEIVDYLALSFMLVLFGVCMFFDYVLNQKIEEMRDIIEKISKEIELMD